jgi:hypothetical protein
MKQLRDAMMDELLQLGELFPSMRFGQLLEMLGTARGALTVSELERTTDAQLYEEAKDFVAERLRRLGLDVAMQAPANSERARLIEIVRQSSASANRPLAATFIEIARAANSTLYDIEDEVLLQKLSPQNAMA